MNEIEKEFELKLDKAINDYIDHNGIHFETFSGQNCHDIEDNECSGWTVGERRCDCGNRRIMWNHFTKEDGSLDVWPEAY